MRYGSVQNAEIHFFCSENRNFYIKSDQLLNGNKDATVDGVHYTDLGSVIHAEAIVPVIRRALRMTK